MSATVPELSVRLPAFNEAESLPEVWSELGPVLDGLARPAEVIFVDDGSTDRTAEIVRSIRRADSRVRLIRLAANEGLSAALAAGFERARGGIVITMDSDLQNDPSDIPRMLASLDGYDAVTGWRRQREDPWLKRASSRIANAVRNAITRDHVRDSACTLRVIRRRCLASLPRFRGFHRSVPTLLRLRGCACWSCRSATARAASACRTTEFATGRWSPSRTCSRCGGCKDRWLRYEATEKP